MQTSRTRAALTSVQCEELSRFDPRDLVAEWSRARGGVVQT